MEQEELMGLSPFADRTPCRTHTYRCRPAPEGTDYSKWMSTVNPRSPAPRPNVGPSTRPKISVRRSRNPPCSKSNAWCWTSSISPSLGRVDTTSQTCASFRRHSSVRWRERVQADRWSASCKVWRPPTGIRTRVLPEEGVATVPRYNFALAGRLGTVK